MWVIYIYITYLKLNVLFWYIGLVVFAMYPS